MKYKIEKIHPHQAGKMGAALLAVLSLIFLPLSLILLHGAKSLGAQTPIPEMSPGLFVALPLFYGLLGYLFTIVACVLYNFLSGYVGAIRLDIVEDET